MQTPLVISFYTANTPYQLEVLNLLQSCQRFEIEHHIEAVTSRGSWGLNVALKPLFIRDKLVELKRPLFWVDADAAFVQKPDFTPFFAYDLAVRQMPVPDRKLKYNSASLFVHYNPKTIAFMNAWAAICEKKVAEDSDQILYIDQISLADLLDGHHGLEVHPMPIGYCKVYDLQSDQIPPSQIVIEQYQASRRFWDLI